MNDLKAIARRKSSSLKSSQLNEISAAINLNSEKRKIFPTITLTASASTTQDSSPTIDLDNDLNIGLRFSLPLYSGGLGQSQTRRAVANLTAAKFRYIDAIREVDLLIDRLWTDIEASKIIIESQKANLAASQDAFIGTSRSEEVGITSLEDVLRANETKLSSEISLSRAQYSLYTSIILLKLYIGEFEISHLY